MALRKCKECGNPVSSKANKCPHCGKPIRKGGCLQYLALIILGIVIWSIYISDNKDTNQSPSNQPINDSSTSKQNSVNKEEIIDTRICLNEALTDIPIKDANGKIIKYDKGVEERYIRKGPGVKYANEPSGPLWQNEKLYALEEKDGWIRFRVTPKDSGWSAWIKKDFTVSEKEIHAERVAKFGESPKSSSWDSSVRCVKEYLKSVAKDPGSLKFEKWSDVFFSEDGWIVMCDFRGKNSFGGYEKEVKWFVIQHGRVVDVKDFDAYR